MFTALLNRRRPRTVYESVDAQHLRLRGQVYSAALDVRRAAVGVSEARALELLGMAMENLRDLAATIGSPGEAEDIGGWARDLAATAKAVRRREHEMPGAVGVGADSGI